MLNPALNLGSQIGPCDPETSALRRFTVERGLEFPGGLIQTRDYHWDHETADVWSLDHYFLHARLSEPAGRANARYLDCDGRVAGEIGRIMFVPPGRRLSSGGITGR